LAASTDRTITIYDLRESSSATSVAAIGALVHNSTPSCIAVGSSPQQLISGAYDGVARLWDLRSMKAAVVSFKAWDGQKKILSLDWKRGLVGIGGEGGLELWRAAENQTSS
jgi:ribosome biogenesis protein